MTEPSAAVITAAIEHCVTPIYKELTLDQAHFLTGISPTILRRRWKFNDDWKDVIYTVGSHMRTTLFLIGRAQVRAAERARTEAVQ